MPTDEELMRGVKQGDAEAFALLVARHRRPALNAARRILRDEALAEDVVQDCFAKVYLLRDGYREGFSFPSYLQAMIRHRCIDVLRQRGRRGELAASAAEEACSPDTPEAVYLRSEARLRLWRAIERLTEEERELLLRYARDQLPYREIARRHHISLAQVKIRLFRIRKKLKKEWENQDER